MTAAAFNVQLETLTGALTSAQGQIQSLELENRLLRQKVELLIKKYFGGQKSEAIDRHQLELLLAGLMVTPVPAPAPTLRPTPARVVAERKPVRQPLPDHLPVERVELVPAQVQQAPEQWRKIGEEITEELDWKPAQFFKRVYVRGKFVRRTTPAASEVVSAAVAEIYPEEEPAVVIAPLPSRLIEKGLPGPGLLSQVVISKFQDHLPLYRQEKIYARQGVKLSRQSLGEWVGQVAFWLKPIYEEIRKSLWEGGYLQVDETPVRYLDPDRPGKSHLGYLWTYSRPYGEVLFDWQTSRGREGPAAMLKEYRGKLQTDGYVVYSSLAGSRPDWTMFGCLAHARRGFHEALEEDRRAAWCVRQMGHLYGVEQALRKPRAGPRLREAVRVAQARPVLQRLEKVLRRWQPQVCRKVCLARPSTTRWSVGRSCHGMWSTARWRSTITWWKTPFGPPPSARKTSSSSAIRTRDGTAR